MKTNKIISFFLALLIAFSVMPMCIMTASAEGGVKSKLDSFISSYPSGSRWTGSFDGGSQCYGFGKLVVYNVFGRNSSGGIRSWSYAGVSTSGMNVIGQITSYSYDNVKSLLSKAKCGDVLQFNTTKQHTMIVYSVESDGVYIYDCNWDGNCGISLRKCSFSAWSGRNSSKLTLLRSDNYDSINGVHEHSYYRGVEAAHPHKVYMKCSCGYYFYTGKTQFSENCSECLKCTGYDISMNTTGSNGVIYDSDIVSITITPRSNNRDAYDNEIKSIKLKIYRPDGSTQTEDFGTNKTQTFYFPISENPTGKYIFYAYVDTTYGSYSGAVDDKSLSLTLISTGLSAYYFTTDDVLYRRIKFSDLNTYLTAEPDDNIASYMRKSDGAESTQIWKLIKNTDNSYTIESLSNGKVLDVYKGVAFRGNKVTTYTSQGSSNQKWKFCKDGDKEWYIKEADSNSAVLDVSKGSTTDGTSVTLWTYHGESSQKVEFEYPYIIKYNANGGSGAPSYKNKDYGTSTSLSTVKPTKSGYTFQSWNTKADGSGTTYLSGASYTANADVTLYAQWKANTYTVTYNSNGGSGAPSSQTKTYGKTLTLTSAKPTRSGYIFQNWNTKADGSGTTYLSGASYTANADVTLYAQWKANILTVDYDPKGGSVSPSGIYIREGSSVELPTPTKSYTLTYNANSGSGAPSSQSAALTCKGWSTSSSATSVSYSCGANYTPSANTTLYAVWNSSTSVTISSTKPTRSGYTFLGWSTSSSATSASYQPGSTITISGNTTLYAVWQTNPISTYTLSYNANGGTVSQSSASVTAGSSVKLPTPTKSYTITYNANGGSGAPSSQSVALTCKGWSTSSSATSASYSCGSNFTPSANTTLYAVWNSSASATLSSTKPTRLGYTFLGWSTSSSATSASFQTGATVTLSGNVALYAVWQKNSQTVPVVKGLNIRESVDLDYKESYTFTPEITADSGANYIVEWESSNPGTVSVDENGNIYGAKKGNATITCTVTDSQGNIFTDTCDVKVSYNFGQWLIIILLFGWLWY